MNISAPSIHRPVATGLIALAITLMGMLGYFWLPVSSLPQVDFPTIQVTTQLPGANPKSNGASTGGRREGVPIIAKAAVAAGADGVFLEFHHDPDKALCDGPSCLPLDSAEGLLKTLKALHAAR